MKTKCQFTERLKSLYKGNPDWRGLVEVSVKSTVLPTARTRAIAISCLHRPTTQVTGKRWNKQRIVWQKLCHMFFLVAKAMWHRHN